MEGLMLEMTEEDVGHPFLPKTRSSIQDFQYYKSLSVI